MAAALIVVLIVLGSIAFYRNKKEQAEITKIQGLDTERKKIELMKLQGRINDFKTNHILHLLLSIFMIGVWIIPWILISNSNSVKRKRIQKLIDSV